MSQEGQEVTIKPGAQLARVGRLFFRLPGNVTEQIQPGKFQVEVSLEDYLGNKTSAIFGEQTFVLTGPIPMYAHESSTVKDPEQAVPTAPVGPTTISVNSTSPRPGGLGDFSSTSCD
jgi:hypothetical protein